MNTHAVVSSIAAAVLVGALPAAAVPADDVRFGPPWISVEYPANPHHPSTRNASFLVRTYHHSDAIMPQMRAVAEGLVNGERRTVKLDIRPTHLPGVFAVSCDLPSEGRWIVAVTLEQGAGSTATALIDIRDGARVAGVDVPSRRTADGWVVPVEVTAGDIDARLRATDRLGAADGPSGRGLHAGLAGLLAVGLALGVRRRRPR